MMKNWAALAPFFFNQPHFLQLLLDLLLYVVFV